MSRWPTAPDLSASADNVMKAMVTRGPYVRFGLSLTTLSMLDSRPDHDKPWDPLWLDDLDVLASQCTVRIERQTTCPMPDLGRALFTVRIYTTPLTDLAKVRPDLIPRLASILRSASPAILEYKGIAEYAHRSPSGASEMLSALRVDVNSLEWKGETYARCGSPAPGPVAESSVGTAQNPFHVLRKP